MPQLHTVNKSPYSDASLQRCLDLANENDRVLLIEDGVYGATAAIQAAAQERKLHLCALEDDLRARGMAISDGIEAVSYAGFVDLAAAADSVVSWY